MQPNQVASQEEWLAARRTLLTKEKAHMRAGDALAAERRALPWLKIEKIYTFDTPNGPRTLAELFDGHQQLIVHHLMFAPDWEAACPGCSFQAEHIDGPAQHLQHHGVKLLAVSRAPLGPGAYRCVSCLNRGHMAWAWSSLFTVGLSDLYVRLCSMGVWRDVRIF